MDSLNFALDVFGGFIFFTLAYWWTYLPVLLLFVLWTIFKSYNRAKYLVSLDWTLLEVKVPRNFERSPRAAEHIFSGLHGVFLPVRPMDAIFKGKVLDWFSLEVVGTQGELHFYVRTLSQYKNLVESQLYAQYSDAEITEVADYTSLLPDILPNKELDLFGGEFILNKEDAYPIRTYIEFEDPTAGEDMPKRVDPLASLSELLSSLHQGEHIWIQTLIRPASDSWAKKAEDEINKIMGKESKVASSGVGTRIFNAIDDIIPGGGGSSPAPEVKKEEKRLIDLSFGKQETIKAIERSISKLGFETIIRFVYIGPREAFHRAHISGVVGSYKQFSSQALNGFKLDRRSIPIARWPFKGQKEFYKKTTIFRKFKMRTFPFKSYVLNTEELATIFHMPDMGVKSPLMPRVETKKGEPPSGLPIT